MWCDLGDGSGAISAELLLAAALCMETGETVAALDGWFLGDTWAELPPPREEGDGPF